MSEPGDFDIATALDLQLDLVQGQKFVALRALHSKKVKQLMASLDAKDKEIAKYKVTTSDNRRSQMIQALKLRIRDLELVVDVTKQLALKKMTDLREHENKGNKATDQEKLEDMEQLNRDILKKTISGPERFRPLTREELEVKIMELEKNLRKSTVAGGGSQIIAAGTAAPSSSASVSSSVAQAKSSIKPERNEKPAGIIIPDLAVGSRRNSNSSAIGNSISGLKNDAKVAYELEKFVDLNQQLVKLREELDCKNVLYTRQGEELSRLRARNAELSTADDKDDIQMREYDDLQEKYEKLRDDDDALSAELAKLKAEKSSQYDAAEAEIINLKHEISELQNHVQEVMKQNNHLLDQINMLDAEVEEYAGKYRMGNAVPVRPEASDYEARLRAKDEKILWLNESLGEANEKIAVLNRIIEDLRQQNLKIPELETIRRDKNIEIRELKKELDAFKKSKK